MKRRKFLNSTFKGILLANFPVFFHACATNIPLASSSSPHSAVEDLKKIASLIANQTKPIKWLFSGDSITHGAKHTYGQRSYPEIFAERIRTEMGRGRDIIINSAISGHTTKDILEDFEWRIGQFSPAVVSLMIGTNDAATTRDISVDQYEKNLDELVKIFRAINAIPIVHTPNTIQYIAPGGDVRTTLPDYISRIYKVVKANDVILVDNWKFWQDNNTKALGEGWFADPLHPSGKGHLQLARLMFKTINIFNDKSFTCIEEIKC